MTLTYHAYLKLDELLHMQHPMSEPPEHDEQLFIIIHQVYELWFKLMLHELEKIKRDFSVGDLFGAIATFKRVRTIMKILVAQLDILETMTPMSFSAFRDRLDTSSGFQSRQFRELEFMLGYKRSDMIPHQPDEAGRRILEQRLRTRSVVDHFYDFLEKQGVEVPQELRNRDITLSNIPNPTVQRGVLRLFTTRPEIAILFETMIDFDEGMQEWRYRHVKLVERTIGHKKGTGGSLGVEFLKKSLFLPIFADLWEVRKEL